MPSPLQGQTNEQHARPDLAFRLPLCHRRTRGRPSGGSAVCAAGR